MLKTAVCESVYQNRPNSLHPIIQLVLGRRTRWLTSIS
jgi:hypothetical protein